MKFPSDDMRLIDAGDYAEQSSLRADERDNLAIENADLNRQLTDLEVEIGALKRLNALQNQNDVLAELRTITGARFGQDIRLVIKCLLETRENWRKTLIRLMEDECYGRAKHSDVVDVCAKALGGYRYADGIHREE